MIYKSDINKGKFWKRKVYNSNNNTIYEIIEGNRFIKEYHYNGNLDFEGECLNGEIKGKGKEYDRSNGSLEFEGEYSNGEINGKGKEYNNGNLEFESEYINGRRSEI